MAFNVNLQDVSISNCRTGVKVSDASDFRAGNINVENASIIGISVANVKNIDIKSVSIKNATVGVEFKAPDPQFHLDQARLHLDNFDYDLELRKKLQQVIDEAKQSSTNQEKISIYERFAALSANHVTVLSPIIAQVYAWASSQA